MVQVPLLPTKEQTSSISGPPMSGSPPPCHWPLVPAPPLPLRPPPPPPPPEFERVNTVGTLQAWGTRPAYGLPCRMVSDRAPNSQFALCPHSVRLPFGESPVNNEYTGPWPWQICP